MTKVWWTYNFKKVAGCSAEWLA